MTKSLFIGNGLNRLTSDGFGWGDLLNLVAGEPENDHEKEIRRHKPFTLWYEEIELGIERSDLKRKIADVLSRNLEINDFHQEVTKLKFQNILTTNYDYCLERACSSQWERAPAAPETLYSLFRRNICDGTNFWHIHGELENSKSIMLGHDQYTGYSQKISNFLSIGVPTESRGRSKKPYISKFSNKVQISDTKNWVDIFLEDEIHMIGFSLDYTENHLWSLISRKNKLKSKFDLGGLVFYSCRVDKPTIVEEAKYSLMQSMGVKVQLIQERTYEDAYHKCLKNLKRS